MEPYFVGLRRDGVNLFWSVRGKEKIKGVSEFIDSFKLISEPGEVGVVAGFNPLHLHEILNRDDGGDIDGHCAMSLIVLLRKLGARSYEPDQLLVGQTFTPHPETEGLMVGGARYGFIDGTPVPHEQAVAEMERRRIEMPDENVKVGHEQAAAPAKPREINDHKVNPANDRLRIRVMDGPGSGGASHHYVIDGYERSNDEAVVGDAHGVEIRFQNGPIAEAGVNGVTQEALLAICIDRLRSFQKGQYSCKENACALTHMEEAQMWLQKRTLDRMRRGVEGTHTV